MKKTIIAILLITNILSVGTIYSIKKNENNIKNVVTTSQPQIIYKDKIIYKQSPEINKILYQVNLFLYDTKYPKSLINYMEKVDPGSVGNATGKYLLDGNTLMQNDKILKGITLYNINNPM